MVTELAMHRPRALPAHVLLLLLRLQLTWLGRWRRCCWAVAAAAAAVACLAAPSLMHCLAAWHYDHHCAQQE